MFNIYFRIFTMKTCETMYSLEKNGLEEAKTEKEKWNKFPRSSHLIIPWKSPRHNLHFSFPQLQTRFLFTSVQLFFFFPAISRLSNHIWELPNDVLCRMSVWESGGWRMKRPQRISKSPEKWRPNGSGKRKGALGRGRRTKLRSVCSLPHKPSLRYENKSVTLR